MHLTIVVLGVLLAFARADFSPVPTAKAVEHLNDTRIVGGHDAKIGQFPHIVLLMCFAPDESASRSFCGGSIIHPQWVLTAAHCVKIYYEECPKNFDFYIAAGRHRFKGNSQPNQQFVKVSKYVVHEKYQSAEKVSADDIVLLKLEKPVMINKFVRPIPLPPAYFEPRGRKVVAAGWGHNNYGDDTFPEVLQTVDMEIIDIETCKAAIALYEPELVHYLHEVTNMCTGPLTGGVSTCKGDSGGPVMGRLAGQDVLIGVVSWGFSPCGIVNGPSVQAKVSNYVFWIKRNMAMN